MVIKEKNILLLGNGGHCRSVIDTVFSMKTYDRVGIVESKDSDDIKGPFVVGTDDDLKELYNNGWTDAFVTVGSVGDTRIRQMLYQRIKNIGFNIPTIIDPSATISDNVKIEAGTFIGKKAIINTNSNIGKCAIINTGAIIEHDCYIGDYVHISPGAVLCGAVRIGEFSHIGAGSTIKQQIAIGERTIIGIGSVVVKNIPDDVVAFGNPCRINNG